MFNEKNYFFKRAAELINVFESRIMHENTLNSFKLINKRVLKLNLY